MTSNVSAKRNDMTNEKITEGLVAGCFLLLVLIFVIIALLAPKELSRDHDLADRCKSAGMAYPGIEARLVTGMNGEQVCEFRDTSGRLVRAIQYQER